MPIIKEEIYNTDKAFSTPTENIHTLCENDYLKKDNLDCLVIYHALVEGFHNCEQAVRPCKNLFALFFHQLIKILTGYILIRNEQLGPYKPGKRELEFSVDRFPYISYMDVINNVEYESKDYSLEKNNLSYKKELFSFLTGPFKSFRKGTIGILPNSLLNRSLLLGLLKNGYNIKFLNDLIVEIDHLEIQIKLLSDCIKKIFINLDMSISPEPIVELVKRHILNRVTEKKNIEIDCDVIVAGSMAEYINNSYGAISHLNSIPFISIVHGEGDQLLFDEPIFGYSDRTYPSILFGFGSGYGDSLNTGIYLDSLYNEPKYIQSNSNFIKKIYNGSEIIPFKDLDKTTWMYVPDSLLYHSRWGPFSGNIPATLYFKWQKYLVNAFKYIFYKRHPKGHSLFRNLSDNNLRHILDKKDLNIISDNFYRVYNKCDGFIFDHISTTFMIAAATKKPIIYFNIGKRNLTKYAEDTVKKRCLWIDVDITKTNHIKDEVESNNNNNFTNLLTPNFSLDDTNNNLSREEKLFISIKSVI